MWFVDMNEFLLPPTESADALFARGLRRTREGLGLSQEQIAARMNELGHRFHQTTVNKLETGQRKASVGEAYDLAGILNVGLRIMMYGDTGSILGNLGALRTTMVKLTRDVKKVVDTGRQVIEWQKELRFRIDALDQSLTSADESELALFKADEVEHMRESVVVARRLADAPEFRDMVALWSLPVEETTDGEH